MDLRVVDDVGNPGGGIRYCVELLRAIAALPGAPRVELVSHGEALGRYREAIGQAGLPITLHDRRSANHGRRTVWGLDRFKLGRSVLKRLGLRRLHEHRVPADLTAGCDVLYLPWVHFHRMAHPGSRTVVTFHDAIMYQFDGILSAPDRERDMANIRSWLASPARIVVTSLATRHTVSRLFGVPPERMTVIRVSGEHALPAPTASSGAGLRSWPWIDRPFLLCPTNLTPHKNHEVLLRALAAWEGRVPLVFTGSGMTLGNATHGRQGELARLVTRLGLRHDTDVVSLGYVDDGTLHELYQRAWAVVVPTLAEGGGSFPTMEALFRGIPVLCSDIPVLREQMEFLGGEVLWFDPTRPADVARALRELAADEPRWRDRFVQQRPRLRIRRWEEVAREYMAVFASASAGGASKE